jgi:hypothetical protein
MINLLINHNQNIMHLPVIVITGSILIASCASHGPASPEYRDRNGDGLVDWEATGELRYTDGYGVYKQDNDFDGYYDRQYTCGGFAYSVTSDQRIHEAIPKIRLSKLHPETFIAAQSSVDRNLNEASIENYITALPPNAFHSDSVEQFRKRVSKARPSNDNDKLTGRDFLFLQAAGENPPMKFFLDRATRMLTIEVYSTKRGEKPYEVTMRRVSGGWMEGAKRKLSGDSLKKWDPFLQESSST